MNANTSILTKPKVSIICTTYNHELFIKDCLEGFLMQETDFPYEILIHDDASTDNTASIIKEYADKYPDIIKCVIQTENQLSKGMNPTRDFLAPLIQGEYVAFCEGDDYWTDTHKLKKQISALESNKDCIMSVCKIIRVDQDKSPLGCAIPDDRAINRGIIPGDKFIELALTSYSFQTSGYVIKTDIYIKFLKEWPKFREVAPVGDVPMMLYMGLQGNIFYIDDVMSAYRINRVSSWNFTILPNKREQIKDDSNKMYEEFNKYTQCKFSTLCTYAINRENYRYFLITNNYEMLVQEPSLSFLNKEGIRLRAKVKLLAFLKRKKND